MAIGQKLKLRLFLEGIEVPVIGAAIQSNVNSPATASIQVIPTDRVLELKPRTMVHLFHWNFNQDLPDSADQAEGDFNDPNQSLRGYRIAFSGEVVGLAFAKTPLGRQAILQCADFSTYWDTTYQIFISYSPNGNFLSEQSSVWAGGNSMFDNISASHSGVMNSYLRRRPASEGLKDVKGLMGGIISLLEAMGGVPNHVSGVNDFFTIAELKNHLLQQITAEQNDDTAQRLFDSQAFSEWLNRGITSLGELVSFRDMLKLLFHWIYYEVVPITSPRFIRAVPPTTTEKVSTSKSFSLSAPQRAAIRDWLKITNRYDGSAGAENSIRNQVSVSETLAARDLAIQIRRFLGGAQGIGQAPISLTKPDGSRQDIPFDDPQVLPEAQVPTKVKKLLEFIEVNKLSIQSLSGKFTVEQLVSAASIMSKSNIRGTDAVSDDVNTLNSNQRTWKKFTKNLLDCLNASSGVESTRTKQVRTRPTLDRLQSQIFRPDCFFVPPPRCNVLFPDQYTQFQFQRNFLQEITRLRLAVGMQFISGPGAGLLTPVYFAPTLSEIKEVAKKQGNAGIRTLLPWEKFTGILPKFESISEVGYIANKRQRQLLKDIKGKGASYSQRSANFNFLKYRFAPRTLTVSAKYSPQFVLGFPGLIIDRPFIIEPGTVTKALVESSVGDIDQFGISDIMKNIGVLAKYFKAPTQYLGMPVSVMSNVDQSGGTTNITFTHARTHRLNDDDFLNSYVAEVTRKASVQTVSTTLDAEELLKTGDYKQLRYLIDATPQTMIEEATTEAIISQTITDNPLDVADDEPLLDLRPNGAPNLATFDQLAPAVFSTANPNFSSGSVVQPKTATPDEEVPTTGRWVGPVSRSQLKGTRTDILVPNPYAKIKPGSPGLKGGSITQIQLLTNSVVAVSSKDIEQFVRTGAERSDLAKRRKNAGKLDRIFLWRKAVIWETVKSNTTSRPIPVEETIRPPWFSPLYSNLFIGDNIYQPFFGTGSIVDEGLFITPEGGAVFGSSRDQDEVLSEVHAADGDSVKITQILDKYKAQTIGQIPSIESAVDALAYLYGEVCRQGLDVQKFIVNYTDRPIATLEDILGSADLEYEVRGDQLVKLSGTAGFHSTAVAPFGNLLGLVDNPDLQLARIHRKGKVFPISKALDPRPDRRAAVQAYADDFGSQGSLGVGLRG